MYACKISKWNLIDALMGMNEFVCAAASTENKKLIRYTFEEEETTAGRHEVL